MGGVESCTTPLISHVLYVAVKHDHLSQPPFLCISAAWDCPCSFFNGAMLRSQLSTEGTLVFAGTINDTFGQALVDKK